MKMTRYGAGPSLNDLASILDAHYLSRDPRPAESALKKRAKKNARLTSQLPQMFWGEHPLVIERNGRSWGTRTHDPRFWRPMLYQLS